MRGAIYGVDLILRQWYGIYEYSRTNTDILRIAMLRASVPVSLPDGTQIRPGDLIVDLHIWNERLSTLGPFGPSLAWGCRVRHRIEFSLGQLARHLETIGYLEPCAAVRAKAVFVNGRNAKRLTRIAACYGLHRAIEAQPAGLGHGLLAYGLTWASNPASLTGKRFNTMRHEFWMSGVAFRARYQSGRPSPADACPIQIETVPDLSEQNGLPAFAPQLVRR
jgi:hypothetical protein